MDKIILTQNDFNQKIEFDEFYDSFKWAQQNGLFKGITLQEWATLYYDSLDGKVTKDNFNQYINNKNK